MGYIVLGIISNDAFQLYAGMIYGVFGFWEKAVGNFEAFKCFVIYR